jgi:hypothetical protein
VGGQRHAPAALPPGIRLYIGIYFLHVVRVAQSV